MKVKIYHEIGFDGFVLTTTSDYYGGETLDTDIHVHPVNKPEEKTYITTIEGNEIADFISDFNLLIKTYAI